MNVQQQNVFDQAMALTPDERADLIGLLLDTLDVKTDPAVETEWAALAQQRLSAYQRGDLQSVDLDEAMKRLETRGQ